MLTQCVSHFMTHDHGGFIIAKFELVQDANIKSNLAARHAKRIELLAAQQVDLPVPLTRPVVPLRGLRYQTAGNAAKALQLRVVGRC